MYEKRLLKHLPNFWDKDTDSNLGKLMTIIGDELNELRTQLDLQKPSRSVQYSTVETLDMLADILDLDRFPGESGSMFRRRVKSYVQGAVGGGTIEQLSFAMDRFFENPSYYFFVEDAENPGSFKFYYFTEGLNLDVDIMKDHLEKFAAAGITIIFEELSGWTTEVNIQEDDEVEAARAGLCWVGHGNVVGT